MRERKNRETIVKYLLPDGRIVDALRSDEPVELEVGACLNPAKLVIDAASGRLLDVVDCRKA